MERHWVFSTALALSVGMVACSGDDTVGVLPDAGADSTTGPSDGSSSAEAGDAAANDAGGAGTTDGGDAGTAFDDEAGSDAGPFAIFVGTNYTNAELSVIDLTAGTVAGNLALADQDSVAYGSGGLGFVVERGIGDVLSLSPGAPWTARATIDLNDSPDAAPYASNPEAVIVTAGTKAYVAQYSLNTVKVVDVASGVSNNAIDLSAFVPAGSPDGLVDVIDGAYDATSQRAYLLLQRINQFDYSGGPPDYLGACLPWHGEIIAVDATTDAIVPLSDAGTSGAIALLGDNPQALTNDFANGRFVIAESGCDDYPDGGADDGGAVTRVGRGIEVATLASATSAWLWQDTASDNARLSRILLADGTHGYLDLGGEWFPWDPTQASPTVGTTAVANFPQGAVYGGSGQVIGLWSTQPDAGSDAGAAWSVVAMSTATGALSTIATSPFKSVVLGTSYGLSSALVP
jgi:hypothetical protein